MLSNGQTTIMGPTAMFIECVVFYEVRGWIWMCCNGIGIGRRGGHPDIPTLAFWPIPQVQEKGKGHRSPTLHLSYVRGGVGTGEEGTPTR